MEAGFYNTIEKPALTEYKEKGSRFIACAFPLADVKDFKERMAFLKNEYPKATHYCFAYRIGLDGSNFRVSDDGEPSGTAGKQILGQIDSRQLTNVLVVVVRYFGGTLLGVPGLIYAYKSVTGLVLQLTPEVQKEVAVPYRLQFDYTQMNGVMVIIKQCTCTIIEQQTHLFCQVRLFVPASRKEEFLYRLKEMRNVEADAEQK